MGSEQEQRGFWDVDGFEGMVDEALRFFGELEQNNSKAWFEPQKARYTEEIKKPAEFFGDLLSEDIARITGKPVKPKLFRIYRDVRFSKDKTPLNTHLHLLWSQPGDALLSPSFFFGLSRSYLMLGMGVMGLQKDSLAAFRALVDRRGDALTEAIAASGAQISDWGPAPLKRVPKPYAPDHPQANLLKRKSFTLSYDLPATWRADGLVKATCAGVSALKPVFDILDQAG